MKCPTPWKQKNRKWQQCLTLHTFPPNDNTLTHQWEQNTILYFRFCLRAIWSWFKSWLFSAGLELLWASIDSFQIFLFLSMVQCMLMAWLEVLESLQEGVHACMFVLFIPGKPCNGAATCPKAYESPPLTAEICFSPAASKKEKDK